jgi:hypothetical protein
MKVLDKMLKSMHAKKLFGGLCLLTTLALPACGDSRGDKSGLEKINDGGGSSDGGSTGGGSTGGGTGSGNDRYEPNDQLNQAATVPSSGTLSAILQGNCDADQNSDLTCKPGSDLDFFGFSLAAATQGIITLTSPNTTADIDMYLLSQDGKILQVSNKVGTSEESITASLAAGIYGILLVPYNVQQATDYTLTLTQ